MPALLRPLSTMALALTPTLTPTPVSPTSPKRLDLAPAGHGPGSQIKIGTERQHDRLNVAPIGWSTGSTSSTTSTAPCRRSQPERARRQRQRRQGRRELGTARRPARSAPTGRQCRLHLGDQGSRGRRRAGERDHVHSELDSMQLDAENEDDHS
jgi:hypothetical protein